MRHKKDKHEQNEQEGKERRLEQPVPGVCWGALRTTAQGETQPTESCVGGCHRVSNPDLIFLGNSTKRLQVVTQA